MPFSYFSNWHRIMNQSFRFLLFPSFGYTTHIPTDVIQRRKQCSQRKFRLPRLDRWWTLRFAPSFLRERGSDCAWVTKKSRGAINLRRAISPRVVRSVVDIFVNSPTNRKKDMVVVEGLAKLSVSRKKI